MKHCEMTSFLLVVLAPDDEALRDLERWRVAVVVRAVLEEHRVVVAVLWARQTNKSNK